MNSIISKRAMRETDLLAFQIALQDSGAGAVMCSYNGINGRSCVRKRVHADRCAEEGFRIQGLCGLGLGRTQSTVKAALAGLDIEMPGNDSFGEPLKKAVESGEVPMAQAERHGASHSADGIRCGNCGRSAAAAVAGCDARV